jgi:drug/metabolite transporter (DMT)-like permease
VGVTAQAYLRAPVGIAIGAYFLGESLSPWAWVGLMFIMAGVAFMTAAPRSRPGLARAA